MRLAGLLLTLSLVACGSESDGGASAAPEGGSKDKGGPDGSTESDQQSPHSMLVADAAALPTCDATAEGWLVYVQAESTFKACQSGTWNAVNIKGEKGDAGAAGVAGAAGSKGDTGAAGAAGADSKVAAEYVCSGITADLDSASDTETWGVDVTVLKFAGGDYLITCSDRRINTTYTYADSSTDTAFYYSDSNGVAAGSFTCVAYYATATFTIATEKVSWKAHSGTATAEVSCTKI